MNRFITVLSSFLLLTHGSALTLSSAPQQALHSISASDSTETAADKNSDLNFWIGLGAGYGEASAVCTSCGEEGAQWGTTANVSLGAGLNRTVLLGVQASMWINGGGIYRYRENNIYRTHFMAVGCYYPWEECGFFGRLGVGLSVYNAYNRHQPPMLDVNGKELPSLVHGEGLALSLAVGYDVRVSSTLFLSPNLSYEYGNLGPLTLNETQSLTGRKPLNLVELNLAVVFRTE